MNKQEYCQELAKEIQALAVVWISKSTGQSIPEIEETLLEVGKEHLMAKGLGDFQVKCFDELLGCDE